MNRSLEQGQLRKSVNDIRRSHSSKKSKNPSPENKINAKIPNLKVHKEGDKSPRDGKYIFILASQEKVEKAEKKMSPKPAETKQAETKQEAKPAEIKSKLDQNTKNSKK